MPQPPKFTYPANVPGSSNEGLAIANADNALQAFYTANATPLGNMTPLGTVAAAAAEAISAMTVAAPTNTVTVPIPSTAAAARAVINVDFVPPLSGPGFDAFVQVNDGTNAAGSAGLIFERIISINAQSAVVQILNQGAGASVGTVTVTGVSYTPSQAGNPAGDAAITALRAALTGNIQLFDKRFNQITTAGTLSRWDPVLGLSPPMLGRASHFPATQGNGFPIFTDGVATAAISSPNSAIYDLSLAHSMVWIGRMIKNPVIVSGSFACVAETSAGSNTSVYPLPGLVGSAGCRMDPTGGVITFTGPSGKTLDGLVCAVALTRVGTVGQYGALPGPMATVTVAAPASNPGSLSIGSDTTGTQLCQGEHHAVLFADHVLSAAELQAVYTYQVTAHPDPSLTDISVHDGDSQTYGTGLADLTANYPTQLIQMASIPRALASVNTGVVAKQLLGGGGLLATAPTLIDPIVRSGRRNQILVLWTGTNDFALGGATVQQMLTGVQSYFTARIGAGWPRNQLVFVTCLSRGDNNIDALRDAFNPQVQALCQSLGIQCAAIHQDPFMGIDGAWSNATFFNADHVHPTAAGYTRIANYLVPIFRAIMN